MGDQQWTAVTQKKGNWSLLWALEESQNLKIGSKAVLIENKQTIPAINVLPSAEMHDTA